MPEKKISDHEPKSPMPKKSSTTFLPLIGIGSLVILIGILIYGELDRRNIREVQDQYALQIKKIETLLANGDCNEAQNEYLRAQETRDKIFKMGLYYSLESHARQAHSIEIAQCYANENAFKEALEILDIETIHDPDYLLKAAIIYENAGDTLMAEKARSIAEKFDTSVDYPTNKKR